jgi:Domain of unknown function (DUF4278)
MQLTYRGLPYSSDASAVEAASEMTGQYRGSTFKIGTPDLTTPHSATALCYRGTTYLRNR